MAIANDESENRTDVRGDKPARLAAWTLWAAIALVCLTSLWRIGSFATVDEEANWHGTRLYTFWMGILDTKYRKATYLDVCAKPGITNAWVAGGGYMALSTLAGNGRWLPGRDWKMAFFYGEKEDRVAIRAMQRIPCYIVCMAACAAIAFLFARASFGSIPLAFPFLFLALAAHPVIRIYSRLVTTDGLMGCFGMLSVAIVYYILARGGPSRQIGWSEAGAALALAVLAKFNGYFAGAFLFGMIGCHALTRADQNNGPTWVLRKVDASRLLLWRLFLILVPFFLMLYVLRPLAWFYPLAYFRIFSVFERFGFDTHAFYAIGGAVVLWTLGVALLTKRGLYVGLARRGLWPFIWICSTLLATLTLVGLVWQQDDLRVYCPEDVTAGFFPPDVFTWTVKYTNTYGTGQMAARMLRLKYLFTILGTTTPLWQLAAILGAPGVLWIAGRGAGAERFRAAAWSVALAQAFLLFQIAAYEAGLFPLYNRYMYLMYFPLALYAGAVLLIAAALPSRRATRTLLVFSAIGVCVHLISFRDNVMFLNILRSMTIENGFKERADGSVVFSPIWFDDGSTMRDVADFMNERYDAASPEEREGMRVEVDFVGFLEFYRGPSDFTFYWPPTKCLRAPYVLATKGQIAFRPAVRGLLETQKPICVGKQGGAEFAWLFYCPEGKWRDLPELAPYIDRRYTYRR